MSKFTKGPWRIKRGTNIVGTRQDVGYETTIASSSTFSSNQVDVTIENEANARLIAAAPELLEACESAANLLRKLGGHNHDPEYSELLAAIAKAKGQEVRR